MADLGVQQAAAQVKGNWKVIGKPTIKVTEKTASENDQASKSIDRSDLSESDKDVPAEFDAGLSWDLGSQDFISFILASVKTAREAIAKAMKGEQNDKTDEAKKFYGKKAQEKIDYAKSLKRNIDTLISNLSSATSKNALLSLIDDIKGLLREVKSAIASGQLPANLKADLETFAAKSDKKLASYRDISTTV